MTLILTGPIPHPGCPLGFCAVCAAGWKSAAIDVCKPALEAAEKTPEQVTVALSPPAAPPAPAVAYGLAILPGPPGSPAQGQPVMLPLPLCWTHLQAVTFTSSGLIPAPPGAILLDGNPRPPR